MSIRNQPYLPLYIQDFMTDEKLSECSASANGVMIRLMCLMHKSEAYGKILLKQKDKQTDNQIKNFASKIAKHFPYTFDVVYAGIVELVQEGVLTIEGDEIIQKRMVYDAELSEKRAKAGSKGGKKTVKKHHLFAKANAKANHQANTEDEDEYEDEIKVEYSNIKVSTKEHTDLVVEFGEKQTKEAYKFLSEYKIKKNYNTRSDYLSIKKWVFDEIKKQNNATSHHKPNHHRSSRNQGVGRAIEFDKP